MLEDELSQIQLASAALPGANSFEFDNGTLAVLRGKCVRYLMRSKEVSNNIFEIKLKSFPSFYHQELVVVFTYEVVQDSSNVILS